MMLDKILKFFGLTRLKNLETIFDASQDAYVDIKNTYEMVSNLMNYDLPPEAKIEINKYLDSHKWVTTYSFKKIK